MNEFILRLRTYNRLKLSYSKRHGLFTQINFDVLICSYMDHSGIIKFPWLCGLKIFISCVNRRGLIKDLLINNYIMKFPGYKNKYRLTDKGRLLCSDFMKDYAVRLAELNINFV